MQETFSLNMDLPLGSTANTTYSDYCAKLSNIIKTEPTLDPTTSDNAVFSSLELLTSMNSGFYPMVALAVVVAILAVSTTKTFAKLWLELRG